MNDINNTINARGKNSNGNLIFLPYDATAPVEEKDKRTIKLMYKTNSKTGKIAGINSCLLVNPVSSEEVRNKLEQLLPHVVNMLEVEQDKIAKALHVSGTVEFDEDMLSVDNVIKSLNTSSVSCRMNKEVIGNWFKESIADNLTVLFADKLGVSDEPTNEETEKLERFIQVYKAKYSGLASNLVSYQKEEAEKLLEAVTKCNPVSSLVGDKIVEKLTKMANPANSEELLLSL